ncbi:MAG: ATP-binding protein [Spirochaetaceae bacterium]|nr:ATP-binding protein [Spirochaetaceae bacterium]
MIDGSRAWPSYIPRPDYIERISPFIGKGLIKVLTGQRRVGKSHILYQLMDEIARRDPAVEITYINKELHEFRAIRDGDELYRYVSGKLKADAPNALFIDEIQEIKGFEHALRSLLAEARCDIYCTGSNADLLSGELATFLAGRHVEIRIHPLSFAEFLRFHGLDNSRESLARYLRLGGMPYLSAIGLSEAVAFEYLENVHASIILRDVVAREKIRNVDFLETLLEYVADNVGNLFSANNISKYLKSQHVAMPVPTVLSYLSALQRAFIIRKARRADLKGMKLFEVGEKYYFEDLGLRNAARGRSSPLEQGKLVENAVYLRLVERGYEVYVGWIDGFEIDFVAAKADRRIYVQAAYLIADEATATREFGNLARIDDNHPKYVVSMDETLASTNYNGIERKNLRDFLLMEL